MSAIKRAIIIGGGIGGLCTAIGLGQIENRLACTARDFLASVTPTSWMMKQLERAAGYEP